MSEHRRSLQCRRSKSRSRSGTESECSDLLVYTFVSIEVEVDKRLCVVLSKTPAGWLIGRYTHDKVP